MSAIGKAASKLAGSLTKKGKEKLGVKTPDPLTPGAKKIKQATKAQKVTQEATKLAKTKGTKTGLKVGSGIGFVAGMAATQALNTLKTQDKQTTKNLSDFEKKFDRARKLGKRTFMYKGNEFNTKLKGKK